MNGINIVKPPGSLQELEESAKREAFTRKGKDAIIENYAKRHNMTIEEAREKLGYKSVRAVKIQMGKGNLVDDGNGGVTDESVEKLLAKDKPSKKEPAHISPVGMTDEKFDKLDDDARIVVTAGMLRQFAQMIRAQERLQMRAVSLEEMFEIAGEAS